MNWRKWFGDTQTPSKESIQAHGEADDSLHQARMDLERGSKKLLESRLVAIKIREHNDANHYDDWLSEQFLKYYK